MLFSRLRSLNTLFSETPCTLKEKQDYKCENNKIKNVKKHKIINVKKNEIVDVKKNEIINVNKNEIINVENKI